MPNGVPHALSKEDLTIYTTKADGASVSVLVATPSDGYIQMPVRPMCSHLAPVGQPPRRHVNAQYLSPLEESWSTHCGFAVVPAGTSVGHVVPVHFGVQVEPLRPWTCTSTSSDLHGGFS